MSRSIQFAPNEFYHVYNRGTEKRDIFLSDTDYQRFLCLLYVANGDKPVDLKLQGRTLYEVEQKEFDKGEAMVAICGYALMPNHYHILLQERIEGGISNFMRKVGTAYTMYFNAKNERSGALFQGKFKAKHIDDDVYLKYLLAYIHLNPLSLLDSNWKEGKIDAHAAKEFLTGYQYSSFLDYQLETTRPESKILSRESMPLDDSGHDLYEDAMDQYLQGRTLYE